MKRDLFKLVLMIIVIFFFGCKTNKLPKERFIQYEYFKKYTYQNDTLKIELKNPLKSPLRVWMYNSNTELQNEFNKSIPVVLDIDSDTMLTYPIKNFDNDLSFASRLGNTSKEIKLIKLELPFPKNKEYRVIQGNNSNFTHNTDYSRYAIDFNLKINDTICSASDGYVVGLIDQYEFGGEGAEWRPFSNYITIYEPNSGLFLQYVHLVKNGSLVKVGDKIIGGQPIALSGNTGQSDMEHLHFNLLKPLNSEDGLKSIPIEFINGVMGEELIKGDVIKN